jgi:predicted O-methyltransferase YrrM
MADGYEFTVDWFSAGAPVWRSMIADIKPRKALEVGAFEGRSAIFLIEHCASFGPFDLTCVDTWAGGVEHTAFDMGEVEARFDRNIARAKAKHACTVNKLKADSALALARLLSEGAGESFDVIYIDGSHQAPDVLSDAVLAFKLLRVGGIMAFDDYLWQMKSEQRDVLNMPKLGIDAFVNTHLGKLNVISGTPLRQLFIAKIAS